MALLVWATSPVPRPAVVTLMYEDMISCILAAVLQKHMLVEGGREQTGVLTLHGVCCVQVWRV